MKKAIVLSVMYAGIFIILAGCIMAPPPSHTMYILDNNQPPRPVVVTLPPPVVTPNPPTVVEVPPSLVVVENVPDVFYVQTTPNMFFYSNVWWYCYGGCWYRSSNYHGPWVSIEVSLVPSHFHHIPEHHFSHAGPPPRYDRHNDNHNRDDHRGPPQRGRH